MVKETDSLPLTPKDEILVGRNIFRFVKETDEDYSPPKKEGIFWVRFKSRFFNIVSILLILTGIFSVYYGVSGIFIINNKPTNPVVQSLPWKPQIELISAALSEEKYDITPSPAIGDINNDGINDIVLPTKDGKVYALDGISGKTLWQPQPIGQTLFSSPALVDMNKDKALDIVVGSNDSRLYIINGLDGKFAFESDILGGNLTTSPVVYDLNKDGVLDVVINSEEGTVHFIYSPIINPQIFSVKIPGEIKSSPAVLSSSGEIPKVVIANSEGKVYLLDGQTQKLQELNTNEMINMRLGLRERKPTIPISATPAIQDLDNNGVSDIVIVTNDQHIACINGKSLELMWAQCLDIERYPISEPGHYSSPVLTDITGNGSKDVVVCLANGKVFGINGANGEILWTYDTGEKNRIISSPALVDLDKNGFYEIIVGGEDGFIYGLDPFVNTSKRLIMKERIKLQPIASSPLIGDINKDGYLDIVFSYNDNELNAFTTNTRCFSNQIIWPIFCGNLSRTGETPKEINDRNFQVSGGSGLIVILGVISIRVIVKKKKLRKRPPIIIGSTKR